MWLSLSLTSTSSNISTLYYAETDDLRQDGFCISSSATHAVQSLHNLDKCTSVRNMLCSKHMKDKEGCVEEGGGRCETDQVLPGAEGQLHLAVAGAVLRQASCGVEQGASTTPVLGSKNISSALA